jgi:hypothetical protein
VRSRICVSLLLPSTVLLLDILRFAVSGKAEFRTGCLKCRAKIIPENFHEGAKWYLAARRGVGPVRGICVAESSSKTTKLSLRVGGAFFASPGFAWLRRGEPGFA